jgi:hypothetical protein
MIADLVPLNSSESATFIVIQSGRTALMWATFKGNIECLRLLLESNVNTEAKLRVRNIDDFLFYIFLGIEYRVSLELCL